METVIKTNLLSWENTNGSLKLTVSGLWVLANYEAMLACIKKFKTSSAVSEISVIVTEGLTELDTVGAQCLYELIGKKDLPLVLHANSGLSAERKALLTTVANAIEANTLQVPEIPKVSAVFEFLGDIGIGVVRFWHQFVNLLGFSGLVLQALVVNLLRPHTWRITSIVAQVQATGFNAIPIVALLTFLVGAVVAFLGATILKDFGAATYTVNLVGFSFLREFAVLLTAILMAGRTASSFTAQIGSMKVNEEIDALKVQGLSPINMLVLPRILAMQISLPILTFVGMVSGILGGMVVCALSLDISPERFLNIFAADVSARHFFIGMSKAPIFAFIIATIGCQQGFRVSGSAESVGEHTTSAVVHSIFVVILLDALAALFFMEMGW